MDAFSAKNRVFRQLDFHRYDLANSRLFACAALGTEHQHAVPAYVLGHPGKSLWPRLHWGHMAFQFHVHTRALTPVHAIKSDTSAI
jgi:hypothetical protein